MEIRIAVRGAIGLNLAPNGNYGMLVRVLVMTNLHISHLLPHSRTAYQVASRISHSVF